MERFSFSVMLSTTERLACTDSLSEILAGGASSSRQAAGGCSPN
jgi:hypothetical protein